MKSGGDYKRHPALHRMTTVDNWKFGRCMVFCRTNVEREGEILYLPWYLIMFYKKEEIPEHLIYQVDLSGL